MQWLARLTCRRMPVRREFQHNQSLLLFYWARTCYSHCSVPSVYRNGFGLNFTNSKLKQYTLTLSAIWQIDSYVKYVPQLNIEYYRTKEQPVLCVITSLEDTISNYRSWKQNTYLWNSLQCEYLLAMVISRVENNLQLILNLDTFIRYLN